MTQVKPLNVEDLIRELGTGRATLKYILDRFEPWLSSQLVNGDRKYSPRVIPILARISDLLSSGMLPSQIEEILESDAFAAGKGQGGDENSNGDIRMNREAMTFIKDMVSDIRSQQERIAAAHEKRAVAEERKAAAIEKRAEAEEKKAAAMNNIAAALQEMNQLRAVDAQSIEIAGQASRALVLEAETKPSSPLANADDDWDDDFEDPLEGLESLLDTPESEDFDEPSSAEPLIQETAFDDTDFGENDFDAESAPNLDIEDTDDLGLLVDEPGLSNEDIDDLSTLIDTVSTTDMEALDGLLEEEDALPELDNLSMLVDQAVPEGDDDHSDLDDLSLLVEQDAIQDMDDLSALVDPDVADVPIEEADKDIPMDDLSLLVDAKEETAPAASNDDLWSLVDKKEKDGAETSGEKVQTEAPLDDLSALIDSDPETPSLKPDITPEEDLAKYKAAVMKIIIELKAQGLSAGETTDRLNKDQVATLSGKPSWKENAIRKIYGFIDSAK